jgi:hypothetical protein
MGAFLSRRRIRIRIVWRMGSRGMKMGLMMGRGLRWDGNEARRFWRIGRGNMGVLEALLWNKLVGLAQSMVGGEA